MQSEIIQSIVGYIAIAIPVTVAIGNLARIIMEWLNQKHKIKTTVIQQTHNITTQYLDRALDPKVPLALRHQLLRFLATPDRDGSRLQDWATNELVRVGNIVEETNRAVEDAENELQAAKSTAQVAAAEKKLVEAIKRQKSLWEPPIKPPMTAAALRAGLIPEKDLSGLVMKGSDLSTMQLTYRKLIGADFSECDLTDASFQGCDLRNANFTKSNLFETSFYKADLRGANLQGAKFGRNIFAEARLEGADFRNASFGDVKIFATYNKDTLWPEGFDPDSRGAVKVDNID